MKYIEKKSLNEPYTLKRYRETTPDANYAGFSDIDQLLKEALLSEQGYTCGYCMRRISLKRNKTLHKPRIEVEHILTQKNNPERDLDFTNMLGVCNGDLSKSEHCDKSKKENNLQILNPHNKNCEQLLTYSLSGEIKSVANRKEVKEDIDLLQLNNQNLIEARKNTIDIALKFMKETNPIKQWTKVLIQKEIDAWGKRGSDNKFRPYCNIVVWFWKQQKQRNRYPAK